MTPDYIKCVKGKLEMMRNSGGLSLAIVNPTPASIRDECIRLYPTRSAQKDKETLAKYFRYNEGKRTLLECIEGVYLDNLKALQKFLLGDTKSPNYRVVEMVAWLIDFEPRPYSGRIDYSKIASNLPEIEEYLNSEKLGSQESIRLPDSGKVDNTKNVKTGEPEKVEPRRKIFALVILVVIAGLTIFAILNSRKNSNGCMYWAGDHYEPSSCIQRGGDTIVVALDANRLRNFRRIMDTSSITENSIGKVWYRINDGEFEFYTSPGKHPVDIQINVRKLTEDSYAKFKKSQRK